MGPLTIDPKNSFFYIVRINSYFGYNMQYPLIHCGLVIYMVDTYWLTLVQVGPLLLDGTEA